MNMQLPRACFHVGTLLYLAAAASIVCSLQPCHPTAPPPPPLSAHWKVITCVSQLLAVIFGFLCPNSSALRHNQQFGSRLPFWQTPRPQSLFLIRTRKDWVHEQSTVISHDHGRVRSVALFDWKKKWTVVVIRPNYMKGNYESYGLGKMFSFPS